MFLHTNLKGFPKSTRSFCQERSFEGLLTVVLKVWFMDLMYQHDLGTCSTRKFLNSFPGLMNQKICGVCFIKSSKETSY